MVPAPGVDRMGEASGGSKRPTGLAGPLGRLLLTVLSIGSVVVAWAWLSRMLSARVFPGPAETLQFLWREWERGRLLTHVVATMDRVLVSFAIAMAAGVLIGIFMGTSQRIERLGSAWLLTGLAIPRIVPIVGAYILIGLNDRAAITAIVLVMVPTIVTQVQEGARALDQRLVQMAGAFRRSRWAMLRHVVAPQLFPYIAGTARSTMSMAWKMVVFAELMGRSNGVGYQISFYFQMFDMRGILAYGLAMIIILAVVDQLMMHMWNWYAFRWRPRRASWIGWGGR